MTDTQAIRALEQELQKNETQVSGSAINYLPVQNAANEALASLEAAPKSPGILTNTKNPSLSGRTILPDSDPVISSIAKNRFETKEEAPGLMDAITENNRKDPRPDKELMDLYVKWDQHTHEKGMKAIKEGENYYKQLEHLKNIWKEIHTLLDDLPESHTFSNELEEAFLVAEEMGLLEAGKREFDTKEIKLLKTKIDAEMEILPQKANIAFGRVSKLIDMGNLVLKVVAAAMEDVKTLMKRANERARAG